MARPLTTSELVGLSGDITEEWAERGSAWGPVLIERPVVVAFDPGAVSGSCVISAEGPAPAVDAIEAGLDNTFAQWAMRKLGEANGRAVASQHRAKLAVVEDVFLHTGSPNVATSLHLARRVGMLLGLATALGFPVIRVLASSWQGKMFGKVPREQGKKLSIEIARRNVSRAVTNDHTADAANLAWFVHMGSHVARAAKKTRRTK